MSFDVPFILPVLPDSARLVEDYEDIISSNWFTNFGPKERAFSAAVAGRIGTSGAVTFTNATIALMGLIRGALGPGERASHILVPSFTFAAGPAAIEWAGFTPLFVDIEPEGLQPDIDQAYTALDRRDDIAAILLCNTFGIGNSAIARWEALAEQHGIPLLIDSAAGFGSDYADGSPVGTAGLAEVFSFHATKPFAIGEGGAVTTDDPRLASTMTSFQNFAFEPGIGATALGLNGKLAEIPAAIGLRQLERFDAALHSRREVLARYRAGIGDGWGFPDGIERSSVCFATIIAPDRSRRDTALSSLVAAGVEARAYYAPVVHRQPMFSDAPRAGTLAVTEAMADRVVSVPVHESMAPAAIGRVLDVLGTVTA